MDLQQLLQQGGDRIEAMARDFASVPRTMDGRVAAGRPAGSIVHVTHVVKTAVTEPLKAAEVQGSAESAKLIARAAVLLGQGNIGAARIVLERAAESGNAQASFMLAETYDPVILSAWGTYGTRGEAAKAREYYAKAHAGGIREAKDRTRRVAPVRGLTPAKRLPLAIKRGVDEQHAKTTLVAAARCAAARYPDASID